jgi:hypothetical protein
MAITRIVALFNLKPGVRLDDYEAWARAVDLPTVNNLPSVSNFEVFRTSGLLGSEARAPYDYVEILDIRDMGQFGEDVATPVMQAVAADFSGMAETTFMVTEKIDWERAKA